MQHKMFKQISVTEKYIKVNQFSCFICSPNGKYFMMNRLPGMVAVFSLPLRAPSGSKVILMN